MGVVSADNGLLNISAMVETTRNKHHCNENFFFVSQLGSLIRDDIHPSFQEMLKYMFKYIYCITFSKVVWPFRN